MNKYILHVLSMKMRDKLYFFIFNTNPRFPPFLLYVRCKSGVTFIRRSFRDGGVAVLIGVVLIVATLAISCNKRKTQKVVKEYIRNNPVRSGRYKNNFNLQTCYLISKISKRDLFDFDVISFGTGLSACLSHYGTFSVLTR